MEQTKVCAKCKKELPLVEFWKDKQNKDGLKVYCKSCASTYRKHWKPKNPKKYAETKQKSRLQIQYNLSIADFKQLLDSQQNKCAICGKEIKLLVDHCHNTLFVRGLLCRNCNLGLGLFEDNPTSLRQAAIYLEQFKNGTT